MDLIFNLAERLNIKQCQLVNIKYFEVSSWYLMWGGAIRDIFNSSSYYRLIFELTRIRLKIRKSVRGAHWSRIKRANVEVHEEVSEELFEKFRLLHKSVAGRSTRPIESWQMQKTNRLFRVIPSYSFRWG